MELNEVKKNVFVSCPFDLLKTKYLPRLVSERINPEIGLNGTILDDYVLKDFLDVKRTLEGEGLNCTVHAPFTDVSPGAVDRRVRQVSVDRLLSAIDISALFSARSMVFHTGWERKIYADVQDAWMENFFESMEKILAHADKSGVPVMLENVFELTTDLHRQIFDRFPKGMPGFCLDAGHAYAFSKIPLSSWLDDLGQRIGHLHLHDNNGASDEHLAPGAGIVDFDLLFSWIAREGKHPVMTLEAHDEATVIPGLMAIGSFLEKYPGIAG